jgi:mono/diheme cytochrome c family protein
VRAVAPIAFVAALAAVVAIYLALSRGGGASSAPADASVVARGAVVYRQQCASCHGANLQGQPNWRVRLPNGRLPAPPHDDSGHTWHHPDDVLFGIVKNGLVPPYAPPGYASDMPAFGSTLSDEDIRAVLAFIESRWSPQVEKLRSEMLGQSRGRAS